jgi:sugar-specific transcriptional regulator TrmB/predicted hydrocarbon binding protein
MRKMQELGLTEYQARVYLTLLDLGSATASQIPSLSRVPRTRVYATMTQLHEKGLVEIIPETPLRYRPVPISKFLRHRAVEFKERAEQMEEQMDGLAKEFAVKQDLLAEERGRFEALYGRKNVRERLQQMYESAGKEIIGIGTLRSPQRIVKSAIFTIEGRHKAGVEIRYAFPVSAQNRADVDRIASIAHVRNITVQLPMYFYVFDASEVLLNHPIPDDDDFYHGDDIAIWTDDKGMARAMKLIAEKIWLSGTELGAAAVSESLWEVAREFLQLLGDKTEVMEGLGVGIGKALAAEIEGETELEVLKRLSHYWATNNMGAFALVSTSPLVLEVETPVDCSRSADAGRALCAFSQGLVASILEVKFGTRMRVKDSQVEGPCNNRCRLVLALDFAGSMA